MTAILDANINNAAQTQSGSTMPATPTTSFPIKLRVGRTVRRTTFPSTATWSDLLDVATSLFGPTTLDLHAAQTDGATYLDEDGDLISLSSTNELQEALKCADQLRRDLTLTLPAADEGMNGTAWGVPGASFVGSSSSGSSRASSVIVDLDGPVLEVIRADEEEVADAEKVSADMAVNDEIPAAPVDEIAASKAVETPETDESEPAVEDTKTHVDPAQVPLPADPADGDEAVADVPLLIAVDQRGIETHDDDVEMRDAKDSDEAVLEAAMAALDNDQDQSEPAAPAAKDQPIRIPVTVVPDASSTPSPFCARSSSTADCSAPRATLTLGDLFSNLFGVPVLDQQEQQCAAADAAQREAALDAERRHRAALFDAERRHRTVLLDADRRHRAVFLDPERRDRAVNLDAELRRRIAAYDAERQRQFQQLRAHQAAALEQQRQQQAYARAIALQRQREQYEREMAIRQQQKMAARHQAAMARAVREYERAMAEVPMMMGGGCPFVATRPSRVAMLPVVGPMMMFG
ncbi:hypothetical protein AMAG_13155 [Allomyces macrogynus ATCC 38327]|uniref:PB1 domain-containing protein n=1 Tax=Allomyces macrogynus (strain ATCC 38327) TaxID=578462 RepID=A0A0L0SZQ7_ALLM3|nr:hypothetical protein AMAG_13155 [Allomyces macrogynus ATCC 38327]|eukprot:KNE67977.1 hypothetical protein AMAG_13155 [Allomyces macrogynus ATCC 38327]